MTYHLLNSAMMPMEGVYTLKAITSQQFAYHVRKADKERCLKSYVGYPQNKRVIKELSGVDVPLSREQTFLKSGDVLLVMKLKYRVGGEHQKGDEVSAGDFEYFWCDYRISP